MAFAERRARLGARWSQRWDQLRRFATRAVGPFPLTPLGLVVLAGCAWALFDYGLGELDLVLLVIGAVGLGLGLLGLLATLTAATVLWVGQRRLRKRAQAGPLDVECGYPVPTGFSLPRLRGLPFVTLSWRWIEPEAEVRLVAERGRLREQVIASRRGQVRAVVRELEVGDIFGLSQVRMRLREARKVRFVPSIGKLKRVDVIRGMAGGDDISHPEGPQDGELYDLRHYNPGDPIRFVLWKVFARTRQLVVRSPERALSPIRQTCAYLVAGGGDEPAAGAARLAVEHGALGSDWVLGADGSADDATRRDQAVDVLARSAAVRDERGGRGLSEFLRRRGQAGIGRAVVFVPGRPGPWLDAVLEQSRGAVGRGGNIEFVVGTDGIVPPVKRGWLGRLALRSGGPRTGEGMRRGPGGGSARATAAGPTPGSTFPVASDELGRVVRSLSQIGRVIVVDRVAGRVYGGGHVSALLGAGRHKGSRAA